MQCTVFGSPVNKNEDFKYLLKNQLEPYICKSQNPLNNIEIRLNKIKMWRYVAKNADELF